MKKDNGKAMQAIATSCLIAASVLRPSLMPPTVFQKAALIRTRPPRPGIADCGRLKPISASNDCPSRVRFASIESWLNASGGFFTKWLDLP